MLVAGLLAQAVGALAYAFASTLGQFYVVAAAFGFIYAGIMPLYAVLVRENFPMRMMGTIMGSTGMAGGHGALYVASFGLGAFLIAMTFRPFPRLPVTAQPQPA